MSTTTTTAGAAVDNRTSVARNLFDQIQITAFRLVDHPATRAVFDLRISGGLVLHGLRVILDRPGHLFIAMPRSCPIENGRELKARAVSFDAPPDAHAWRSAITARLRMQHTDEMRRIEAETERRTAA